VRRPAAVALVAGAAVTAAVVGGLAPFTSTLLGAAGTAAGAVLDGSSSSPPAPPPATATVQAAPAAKVKPKPTATVPDAQLAQARQACSFLGGQLVVLDPTDLECANIPYIGADGVTYYTSTPISYGGATTGSVHTYQEAATLEECRAGNYPLATGLQSGMPGSWNPEVNLCQPDGAAAPLWACTIMSSGGSLEIRAGLSSGYAKSVTVNFSDNQRGHVFAPVTYPVGHAAPYTLWEPVPPGDIGASAEPTACTAS
jgi:hypothetical protein